jgi:hypothetical protein
MLFQQALSNKNKINKLAYSIDNLWLKILFGNSVFVMSLMLIYLDIAYGI